jgi:hypothetical protein
MPKRKRLCPRTVEDYEALSQNPSPAVKLKTEDSDQSGRKWCSSPVWQCFQHDVDTGKAVCVMLDNRNRPCGASYVVKLRSSTHGMWQHLLVHHPDMWESLQPHPGVHKSKKPCFAGAIRVSDEKQAHADRLFALWVGLTGQQASVCNDLTFASWCNLVSSGKYTVPSVETVGKYIVDWVHIAKANVQKVVALAVQAGMHIHLMMDFWTWKSISVLGITMSTAVKGEDNVYKKVEMLVALHDARFEDHTQHFVVSKLKDTMNFLNINMASVASITCDGGSNLVAALKVINSPVYMWCCCHQLHLIARSILSNKTVVSIVDVLRKVGKYMRMSLKTWMKFCDYVQQLGLDIVQIPKDVNVRWMSMHNMISCCLRSVNCFPLFFGLLYTFRYEQPLKNFKEFGKVDIVDLGDEDWLLLHDIQNILSPVSETSLFLERESMHFFTGKSLFLFFFSFRFKHLCGASCN